MTHEGSRIRSTTPWWVIWMPFGSPVEPEVYMT
jgi:hypothetical protein